MASAPFAHGLIFKVNFAVMGNKIEYVYNFKETKRYKQIKVHSFIKVSAHIVAHIVVTLFGKRQYKNAL